MSEPYLGEIRAFGFNFAPTGWFPCDGRTLAIQNYAALFSLIGTFYGGNGTTSFQLPNLQGRVPMHWSVNTTPPGRSETQIGEVEGAPTVTLNVTNLPSHQHTIYQAVHGGGQTRTSGPSTTNPLSYFTSSKGGYVYPTTPASTNTVFSQKAIGPAGSSQPHENMQPYLAVYFAIAYVGVFPSRN